MSNEWVVIGRVVGRDGVDGTDGVDGRDGVDGTDGIDGTDGVDGRDGVDGTDGEHGGYYQITARLSFEPDTTTIAFFKTAHTYDGVPDGEPELITEVPIPHGEDGSFDGSLAVEIGSDFVTLSNGGEFIGTWQRASESRLVPDGEDVRLENIYRTPSGGTIRQAGSILNPAQSIGYVSLVSSAENLSLSTTSREGATLVSAVSQNHIGVERLYRLSGRTIEEAVYRGGNLVQDWQPIGTIDVPEPVLYELRLQNGNLSLLGGGQAHHVNADALGIQEEYRLSADGIGLFFEGRTVGSGGATSWELLQEIPFPTSSVSGANSSWYEPSTDYEMGHLLGAGAYAVASWLVGHSDGMMLPVRPQLGEVSISSERLAWLKGQVSAWHDGSAFPSDTGTRGEVLRLAANYMFCQAEIKRVQELVANNEPLPQETDVQADTLAKMFLEVVRLSQFYGYNTGRVIEDLASFANLCKWSFSTSCTQEPELLELNFRTSDEEWQVVQGAAVWEEGDGWHASSSDLRLRGVFDPPIEYREIHFFLRGLNRFSHLSRVKFYDQTGGSAGGGAFYARSITEPFTGIVSWVAGPNEDARYTSYFDIQLYRTGGYIETATFHLEA